jgi:hypothetical protein
LNNVNTFHITHSQAPCSRHLQTHHQFPPSLKHLCSPGRCNCGDTYSSKGFTNRPPTRNGAHRTRARPSAVSGTTSTHCCSTRDSSSFSTDCVKCLRRRISERRAASEMRRYSVMPELKAMMPVARRPGHLSRRGDMATLPLVVASGVVCSRCGKFSRESDDDPVAVSKFLRGGVRSTGSLFLGFISVVDGALGGFPSSLHDQALERIIISRCCNLMQTIQLRNTKDVNEAYN